MKIKTDMHKLLFTAIAFILAVVVIFSSVMTVAAAVQSKSVESNNDSGVYYGKTEHEMSNGDLLVAVNNNFEVSVDVVEANEIKINYNGKTTSVMLAKGTVADALKKADITLDSDMVSAPSKDTDIIGDMVINIYDAKLLSVTADNETSSVLVPLGNIVNGLNVAGYNVTDDDILSVSKSENTENISAVTVQRVTYGEETSTETIAYDTVHENSDKVDLGSTKVKTKGVNGEKLVTKTCKYIDGKKVSESVKSTKVTKKAVDEVVLVGTKGAATSGGAGTFTDMYGNKVAYKQVLTGSGTAYTAPAGAGTATGVRAYHGGVAVNPNIIPYGSKLYVVSTDGSFVYGYATAVDTGGALMDGSAIVDCFYNTYGECVNFGRRNMNVYVIS